MSAAAGRAKQHRDAPRYTQVKVSVAPEIATAFRAVCDAGRVSMASEISRFMALRAGLSLPARPRAAYFRTGTRGQRRESVKSLTDRLAEITAAEQAYMENIPENLHGSKFYDAAEASVSVLEEALDLLREAY